MATGVRGGREWLRVSDTGQGLDVALDDSQGLFEPFERRLVISHDNQSIALGGQGLGLTIARMIAHRRAVDVRFVEPPERLFDHLRVVLERSKKMKVLVCDDLPGDKPRIRRRYSRS